MDWSLGLEGETSDDRGIDPFLGLLPKEGKRGRTTKTKTTEKKGEWGRRGTGSARGKH